VDDKLTSLSFFAFDCDLPAMDVFDDLFCDREPEAVSWSILSRFASLIKTIPDTLDLFCVHPDSLIFDTDSIWSESDSDGLVWWCEFDSISDEIG